MIARLICANDITSRFRDGCRKCNISYPTLAQKYGPFIKLHPGAIGHLYANIKSDVKDAVSAYRISLHSQGKSCSANFNLVNHKLAYQRIYH